MMFETFVLERGWVDTPPGLRKLRVVHGSEGEWWRATKVEKGPTLVGVLFQTMER